MRRQAFHFTRSSDLARSTNRSPVPFKLSLCIIGFIFTGLKFSGWRATFWGSLRRAALPWALPTIRFTAYPAAYQFEALIFCGTSYRENQPSNVLLLENHPLLHNHRCNLDIQVLHTSGNHIDPNHPIPCTIILPTSIIPTNDKTTNFKFSILISNIYSTVILK